MKNDQLFSKQNKIIIAIAFFIAFIIMLLINTDSGMYGRRDYYRDHPNSSKSYEEWTQEREFVNKIQGNY